MNVKKIRKIGYLALGLDRLSRIIIRGGADLIDVDCGVEESLRYLDNDWLRKIIHNLYRRKRKGKINYITATALCYLADEYGQRFLAFPVTIGDFRLKNFYQTARKAFISILLGGVGLLWVYVSPVTLIFVFVLSTSGLRLAFMNLNFIKTSPISETDLDKNLNL